jgi:hypothetical protein
VDEVPCGVNRDAFTGEAGGFFICSAQRRIVASTDDSSAAAWRISCIGSTAGGAAGTPSGASLGHVVTFGASANSVGC